MFSLRNKKIIFRYIPDIQTNFKLLFSSLTQAYVSTWSGSIYMYMYVHYDSKTPTNQNLAFPTADASIIL